MQKKLNGHSGSIHRNTQAGNAYSALKKRWMTIGTFQNIYYVNSGSAIFSSVRQQLPKREVMVAVSYYLGDFRNTPQETGAFLWEEFHIFESKKAARAWAKKTKPRSWRFAGEGR